MVERERNSKGLSDNENIDDYEVIIPKKDDKIEAFGLSNEMEYDYASKILTSKLVSLPAYTARFLDNSGSTALTLERLAELCVNAQTDISKVREIAMFARKYANYSDLHSILYEAMANNTNTSFSLNFPESKNPKEKSTTYQKNVDKVKLILQEKFFDTNDVESLIRSTLATAYLEGNKILNLRQTKDSKYVIEAYPLGIAEISDYLANGQHVININVETLRSKLNEIGIKDKKKKKENGMSDLEEELKRFYPPEVYEAYRNKEKYAKLNVYTSGAIKNKDMGSKYGVSAFLSSFKSTVQLENIDASDATNTKARAKKFVVQILRKELLGTSGKDKHFVELNFATENLFNASARQTSIMTAPAYVEDVKLLEFKNELTPIENINYYRFQTMNALGVGFASVEANTKFTGAQITFKEMIKSVNKLSKQLSAYLNKCLRYVVENEGGKLLDYCPTIVIDDAEWLDSELRMKLSTYLFTMLGSSYETAYGLVGVSAEEEKRRREQENGRGYETIFTPRASSYTTTGDNKEQTKEDNAKDEENQNPDKDQQKDDEERNSG